MLEEVVELLQRPRRRLPLEARQELTDSYAKLIIANGFARLGHRERAIELGKEARDVLGEVNDPVHSFLVDAYCHRLECALALQPRTQRLPARLIASLDALNRVARYKVDRLQEASPTLAVTGRAGMADAIGDWIQRRTPALSTDVTRLDDLRTIEEPVARAALIERLFEQPESEEVISACIDALAELPHEVAVPLLPDVAAIAPRHAPIVRARACFVMARFGFGELAVPLISSLREDTGDPELIVPPLLRSMRWLGLDQEIATTVDKVLQRTDLTERFRFIIAGADLARGDKVIDAAIKTHGALPERLARFRAIGGGASYAAGDRGAEILRTLFGEYAGIGDTYGTNSHFCLSVLSYIESLVLAICDLELANVNVLDSASQQLLCSGFAF